MAIAAVEDVATSLRRDLTEAEAKYAPALLNRAENLIRVRIPEVVDRSDRDPHFRDLVTQVEAEALARVYRADESGASGVFTSESEDGYGYSLNLKVASGLLDVLPEEWGRLLGTGGWGTIAPVTDGYAAARRQARPDLWFQYGWPARDQLAERW